MSYIQQNAGLIALVVIAIWAIARAIKWVVENPSLAEQTAREMAMILLQEAADQIWEIIWDRAESMSREELAHYLKPIYDDINKRVPISDFLSFDEALSIVWDAIQDLMERQRREDALLAAITMDRQDNNRELSLRDVDMSTASYVERRLKRIRGMTAP